jgi:hypothetical protein
LGNQENHVVAASRADVSHIAFPSALLCCSSLRLLLIIIFLPNRVDDHLFPSGEPSSDPLNFSTTLITTS